MERIFQKSKGRASQAAGLLLAAGLTHAYGQTTWEQLPGLGNDIAVTELDVFVVGSTGSATINQPTQVWRWNETSKDWSAETGLAGSSMTAAGPVIFTINNGQLLGMQSKKSLPDGTAQVQPVPNATSVSATIGSPKVWATDTANALWLKSDYASGWTKVRNDCGKYVVATPDGGYWCGPYSSTIASKKWSPPSSSSATGTFLGFGTWPEGTSFASGSDVRATEAGWFAAINGKLITSTSLNPPQPPSPVRRVAYDSKTRRLWAIGMDGQIYRTWIPPAVNLGGRGLMGDFTQTQANIIAVLDKVVDAGTAQTFAGGLDSVFPAYLMAKSCIDAWLFPAGGMSATDLNNITSNVGRMSQQVDSKVTALLAGPLAPTVSLFLNIAPAK